MALMLCKYTICETCKRYILDETGFQSCTGYPEGIPDEIYRLPLPEERPDDGVMWKELDE